MSGASGSGSGSEKKKSRRRSRSRSRSGTGTPDAGRSGDAAEDKGKKPHEPYDELALRKLGLITAQPANSGTETTPSASINTPGHIAFPSKSREAVIVNVARTASGQGRPKCNCNGSCGGNCDYCMTKDVDPGPGTFLPMDELEELHRGLVTKTGKHLRPGQAEDVPPLRTSSKLNTAGHIGFPTPSREALVMEFPAQATSDEFRDIQMAAQQSRTAARSQPGAPPMDELEELRRGLVTKTGHHIHPGSRDQPVELDRLPDLGKRGHIGFPTPSREALVREYPMRCTSEEFRSAQAAATRSRQQSPTGTRAQPWDELEMQHHGLVTKQGHHLHQGVREALPDIGTGCYLGTPGHIGFPERQNEARVLEYTPQAAAAEMQAAQQAAARARQQQITGDRAHPWDELEMRHHGLVTKEGHHRHPGQRDPQLNMGVSPNLGTPGHIGYPLNVSNSAEGSAGQQRKMPMDELEMRHLGLVTEHGQHLHPGQQEQPQKLDRLPNLGKRGHIGFPTPSREALISEFPCQSPSGDLRSAQAAAVACRQQQAERKMPMDELEMRHLGLVTKQCQHLHPGQQEQPQELDRLPDLGKRGHIGFPTPSKEALVQEFVNRSTSEEFRNIQVNARVSRGYPDGRRLPMDELEMQRQGLVTKTGQHLHQGGPADVVPPPLPRSSKLGTAGHIGFPTPSREALVMEYPAQNVSDEYQANQAAARQSRTRTRDQRGGPPMDELEMQRRGLVTKKCQHLHPGTHQQPVELDRLPDLGKRGHIGFPTPSREALVREYPTRCTSEEFRCAQAAASLSRQRKQPMDELEMRHHGLVTREGHHMHPGCRDNPAELAVSPQVGSRGHVGFPSMSREALVCEYPCEASASAGRSRSCSSARSGEGSGCEEMCALKCGLERAPGVRKRRVVGGGELTVLDSPPRLAYLLQLPTKVVYVEKTPAHSILISAASKDGLNWVTKRLEKFS